MNIYFKPGYFFLKERKERKKRERERRKLK
jgi:hypothetical protein